MIWSKEECLSREEIQKIQTKRLIEQVHYAYEKLLPYRKKMDEQHIRPEDIHTLKDLRKLPFVVKDDFRQNYPFGMFAVEKKELVRLHASSGTTGRPTVVGYTKEDMKQWTETVTRIACMGGAREGQTAQICFGYGMFTGALGLHYGLENLSCDIIPSSVGNTEKQLMYMKDLGTEILVATPSYAQYLTETILAKGMTPSKDFQLKIGLMGGEALSEKMRRELTEMWDHKVLFTQNYGMSELNGPGVAGECECLNGMHINEDHFIAEIIDPQTGEVKEEGEGELVITCLTKKSMPLIRYRTKDLTRLHYEKCDCGRTTVRMEPLKGRSDDMLVIRGVNVFPTQIEEVLNTFEEVGSNYEIEVTRVHHMDRMEVKVELLNYDLLDSFAYLEKLEKQLETKIKSMTGVSPVVTILAPRSLKRFEKKAKRVNDLREI